MSRNLQVHPWTDMEICYHVGEAEYLKTETGEFKRPSPEDRCCERRGCIQRIPLPNGNLFCCYRMEYVRASDAWCWHQLKRGKKFHPSTR